MYAGDTDNKLLYLRSNAHYTARLERHFNQKFSGEL